MYYYTYIVHTCVCAMPIQTPLTIKVIHVVNGLAVSSAYYLLSGYENIEQH